MNNKYTSFFLSFAIITIISCNKNDKINNPIQSNKKFPISFNVSSFNQVISQYSSKNNSTINSEITGDSLKKIVNLIGCYIVQQDAPNPIKHFIAQDSSDSNFGEIIDSLPYGKYTAYFSAFGPGVNNSTIFDQGGLPMIIKTLPDINFSLAKAVDYEISNSDAFIGHSNAFQVDGVSDNQNIQINLNRIVGKILLKLEDDAEGLNFNILVNKRNIAGIYKASSNKYTRLSATDETLGLYQSNYNGNGSDTMYAFEKLSTGLYQIYMPYTDKLFDMQIQTKLSDGTTKTKTIKNVICEVNKITTVSGKFADIDDNTELKPTFKININPTWSTDTTKIKF